MVKERKSRRELFTSWMDVLREATETLRNERRTDPARALRPPGALVPDEKYLEACTGCGDCIPVCPVDAIFLMEVQEGRQVAVIDPRRKPCYLCTDLHCIAACPEGALAPLPDPRRVRIGIARVDPRRCVTFKGQTCTLCFKACPYPNEAITMVGGRPLVSSGACTGCGLCEYACPTSPRSITIIPERDLVPGLRVPKSEYQAG